MFRYVVSYVININDAIIVCFSIVIQMLTSVWITTVDVLTLVLTWQALIVVNVLLGTLFTLIGVTVF